MEEQPEEVTCTGGITISLMAGQGQQGSELRFDAEKLMLSPLSSFSELYQKLHDEGTGF